ncbi:MAG: sigma-54 dependent transcriptional regulator [Pseudomonadota bacterium]
MRSSMERVLVVDDEKDFCEILFVLLKSEGFEPMVAYDGETAIEMISRGIPDAVLLDVRMPGIDGMQVLRRSNDLHPKIPVLLMTAYGGIDNAVAAVKAGAWDYLSKPFDNGLLIEKLKRAISRTGSRERARCLPEGRSGSPALDLYGIISSSEVMAKVKTDIAMVAPSNFTVIIQGESGTGKELAARAIHKESTRAGNRLVSVDCGAIPEGLFESELFGYEKGAFTGAYTHKAGKFQLAQGGTLFLDEIGNMPIGSQVKLLRAIQERAFFSVGGKEPISVDVRLVVATNQNLVSAIGSGSFNRDLFYRLSEFTIRMPPLREREGDILHLANRFLEATNVELNKAVRGFSEASAELLLTNSWPGNVRQLRATVRRAVLQADDMILPEHLSVEGSSWKVETGTFPVQEEPSWDGLPLKEIVRRSTAALERRVIGRTLRKTGGNKAEAARLLQVDYKTIHSKIKQYGISIFREGDDGKEE